MTTISMRDFRSNLAATFDKADAGEQVLVRRGNKLYTIVPVDIATVTPNAATLAAIKEAQAGQSAGALDMSSYEAFLASIDQAE